MAKKPEPTLSPYMEAAIKALNALPKMPITIPTVDLSRFVIQNDALTIFPEIQKQFAAQSEQIANIQRHLQHVALPSRAAIQEWRKLLSVCNPFWDKFSNRLQRG